MRVKTERRLGLIAASLLTAAAFAMPTAATHLAQNNAGSNVEIRLAAANALPTIEQTEWEQDMLAAN